MGQRIGFVGSSQASDGELEFAGIRQSIFDTFRLPWPGNVVVDESSSEAIADPAGSVVEDEVHKREVRGSKKPLADKNRLVSRPEIFAWAIWIVGLNNRDVGGQPTS